MQVQLIHPPLYVNPRALTALRPAPPLGLAYVTAALKRAGHRCSVLDSIAAAPRQTTAEGRLLRLGLTDAEIVDRIDPDARVLAVTNMWSFCWPAVRGMLRRIRERYPEKIIVCGGEHFTALPEFSMGQAPIDYIVMGEGEEIAVELFERLEAHLERGEELAPERIAGIAWRREDGSLAINPRAARTRDVDSLPWPAWEEFDLRAYDENNFVTGIKFGMTVPILATRGCPYQCTYCSSPGMWTTRWYARNPVDVADEIQLYHREYGATNFPFQDLTAILRKDWIVAFCKELVSRGLDVSWQLPTGTRCEVVDEEVAELLRRSGGRSLSVAPESGSERTRKLIKKRMKTESLMRAVDAAVGAGLNVSALLVIGFPHDTTRDVLETMRLVHVLAKKGVEDVACAFFFPIPATELYYALLKKGRIRLDDDFLATPIFVHDRYLSEERNYCESIPAWRLTLLKYAIVATFYLTQYLWDPTRALRRVSNLVRGREESKMDTFLLETRRRLLSRLRGTRAKALPAQSPSGRRT
jgi:radical SAM superfamily enzyme YgiQ (UPF0313 family)